MTVFLHFKDLKLSFNYFSYNFKQLLKFNIVADKLTAATEQTALKIHSRHDLIANSSESSN